MAGIGNTRLVVFPPAIAATTRSRFPMTVGTDNSSISPVSPFPVFTVRPENIAQNCLRYERSC